MSSPSLNQHAPTFTVVPMTGIQICRRLSPEHLRALPDSEWDSIWKEAIQLGKTPKVANPLLSLIERHIACDQLGGEAASGWIACAPNEAAFFRLIHIGATYALDLVIDTENGAGRIISNQIECIIRAGGFFKKTSYHLASFYVEASSKPRNEMGSLVMDFGNTGSAFIFSPNGAQAWKARPVPLHNPFDPHFGSMLQTHAIDKSILKSTTLVLRAPEHAQSLPWLVLGHRAEEVIATEDPLATSLYAPKKYVRDWPEHLRHSEPTTPYRGLMGQQIGLFPKLNFVRWGIRQMLQLAVSSLLNPQFSNSAPGMYPQMGRVLLRYPLTWREVDKAMFRQMVEDEAREQFVLEDSVREQFQVELVCSEPVAVASYILWEVLHHFLHRCENAEALRKPSLVSSLMGNMEGTPELRLLIVDIGGGSTDIALVEGSWEINETEGTVVDVTLQVAESLRFNRAGDRLTHIMVTAVMEYLRKKWQITESLDYSAPSMNPAFDLRAKKNALFAITTIVEQAKIKLGRGETWILEDDEALIQECFYTLSPSLGEEIDPAEPPVLQISPDTLQQWVEEDYGSVKTHGEPGFMDIFFYLGDLQRNLQERDQPPHLVILSGRTTRLPFMKEMVAEHLKLPMHRVRTLNEILPEALQSDDHQNIDKLCVVHGAHRFQFGYPIRFTQRPEEPVFKRFIGTINETPSGLKLNRILVEPAETTPRTCTVQLQPNGNVLIGNSFRSDGTAQVIAQLSNGSSEPRQVEITLRNDYVVELKKSKAHSNILLTEWVPGGSDMILDNINDTGRIDCEPDGFIQHFIQSNKTEWYRSSEE